MAPEATNAPTTQPVRGKKKRGMKRFKGLLKSRRGKKSSNQTSTSSIPQASNTPYVAADVPDDNSTVYEAQLDASVMGGKSVSSASLSTAKSTIFTDPVQVILLIMDPATRRFELLQLEFDSAMAKVSDIYKQIPTAATEEVLQKASYKAVITPKGEELKRDANLSDYVKGAAIVIAVPENTTESLEKCASMAAPILTNSKVHKMLISSGVKPSDLPEKPKKVKKSVVVPTETTTKEATAEPATTAVAEEKEASTPTKKDSSNAFILGLLFAVFAHLLYKAHTNMATPLVPGSKLPVGKTRNSCGIMKCNSPITMTMGQEGNLDVFKDGELVYTLTGGVCAEDNKECTDGVVVQEDGTILIGGQAAKKIRMPSAELMPWPFPEDVVIKTGLKALI